MPADHLVKILAERGVASRRGSERLIKEGLVRVDRHVEKDPARQVDPNIETIHIEGRPLPRLPDPVHLVLHKPRATMTTRSDPDGRRTVFDVAGELHPSIAAVGRLDYQTEGVLLLTNDGELAYRLTHPSYGVQKSYLVKVSGTPEERKLNQLARGISLEDGRTGPALVELVRSSGPSSWLLIVLSEGRNRIVRRMIDHIGHRTLKLKRIGFGGITLRGLESGEQRSLTSGELEHLRRLVRTPGRKQLKVSFDLRKAIAESLRLPVPTKQERSAVVHRDEEGRPYRKKGWARPKAKTTRGTRKSDSARGPRKGGSRGGGKGSGRR